MTPEQSPTPDSDYVLVPAEMSRAMMEAGQRYINSIAFQGNHTLPACFRWVDFWSAMLGARPTPADAKISREIDAAIRAAAINSAEIVEVLAPADDAPEPDEDPPCTDCGDTGITFQTERRCACQPPIAPADDAERREGQLEAAKRAIALIETPDAPASATTPWDWLYWLPESRERFDRLARAALSALQPRETDARMREALARISPPVRVEAFNSISSGKADFAAMLIRDDEPGCASILAQQMQDQTAEDIAYIINRAALEADRGS